MASTLQAEFTIQTAQLSAEYRVTTDQLAAEFRVQTATLAAEFLARGGCDGTMLDFSCAESSGHAGGTA